MSLTPITRVIFYGFIISYLDYKHRHNGTSDNPIDPRLAPLDFYGGPTQTLALLPDSPAIDAGDPTVLDTDPTTDQRGFPRVSNGRADIGAFEVQV